MRNRTILIAVIIVLTGLAIFIVLRKDWFSGEQQKYAYLGSALIDAPSTIAVDLLKQSGISPVSFTTGVETAQALMGGAAFVATFADWPFLLASNNRSDLRVIGVITSAQSMGILANRAEGIDSVIDLTGKRVGFPQGTSAQFVFESFLNSAGVENVNTVNLPPPQLQPAMLRGDIHAMVVWQPFLELARLEKPDDFFYIPGSQEAFRIVYCLVSTEENIKNDPEGIKRILEALIKAENELSSGSPDVLAKIIEKTGLDLETLTTLLPLFRFKVVIDNEIIEAWKELAIWANSTGLTSADILEQDWRTFIHDKTLRELDPDRVRF